MTRSNLGEKAEMFFIIFLADTWLRSFDKVSLQVSR